jgi:hypothetical protein
MPSAVTGRELARADIEPLVNAPFEAMATLRAWPGLRVMLRAGTVARTRPTRELVADDCICSSATSRSGCSGRGWIAFIHRQNSAGRPSSSAFTGHIAKSRGQPAISCGVCLFNTCAVMGDMDVVVPGVHTRVRKKKGELHEEGRTGVGFGGCWSEPRWLLCRQGQGSGSGRHQGLIRLAERVWRAASAALPPLQPCLTARWRCHARG